MLLNISAENFLSNLPEGVTGILVGDEYIPFSQFRNVEDNAIVLHVSTATPLTPAHACPPAPCRTLRP